MPRDKAVGDFNFKQVIPYVVFMDSEDRIFSYTRNGSESRLHNSISVGIGGHINPEDFQGSAMNMLLCNIERELDEEVMVFSPAGTWVSAKDLKVVGPEAIIYAGGDPFKHLTTVNEVHLGLLYYCFLPEGFSMTMGSEGKAGSFQTFEELNSKFDSLEAWMKIVRPFLG